MSRSVASTGSGAPTVVTAVTMSTRDSTDLSGTASLSGKQDTGGWNIIWDANAGQYFFSNVDSGETRWEPPPEYATVFKLMPAVQALALIPRGDHAAAKVLQAVAKMRERGKKKPLFEKHLDTATGRYYFKQVKSKETTWDTPTGYFPLTRPPKGKLLGLAMEQDVRRERRKRAGVERRALIQIRREQYEKTAFDRHAREDAAKHSLSIEVWNEAFKLAVATGELKVTWQKLGDFHEDVPRFEERFGQPLQSLRLMGHELTLLPPDFGDSSLTSLTSLSLASNLLERLPDSICKLTRLRVLNLLRNRLVALPPKIGMLSCLETLYISSNRLEFLPQSFGALARLDRVEVNSNKLRSLPDSIGRLKCHTFAANGNLITKLTPAVSAMANLTWLSLCDNRLEYLPKELGDCSKLERLHLMGNSLVELPEQIGQLTPLRELMLAQNSRISTLPETFYQLSNLRTLNMEMCPSMVFPPLKYLEQGVGAVLAWSESRIAHHRHLSKQRVVDRLANLCDQLHEQGAFFGRQVKAFFEANVEVGDEKYYAIALPKNNFIPVMVSVKRLNKILDAEANRKIGKSKAAKAEEEDRALLAGLSPGKLHPDVARKVCEKVLGWIPVTARGGDKGLKVREKYKRLAEEQEAKDGELVAKKLGGGDKPDSQKDAAAEGAAKRAVIFERESRQRAEAEEVAALGESEDTCVVMEAMEGSGAAAAGVGAGQRVASVGGVEVADWRSFLTELLKQANPPEDDVKAAAEKAAAEKKAKGGGGGEGDDEGWRGGAKPEEKVAKTKTKLKGPKEIEVRLEMAGGRAALFWEKLLPPLEEYWSHGRDNPDDFVIPKRYAQAFPYERDYVDKVLRTFRDPWSAVCIESADDKPVFFRRCGCVDERGRRKVCVPPMAGFMCSRKALLLKMEVKLQRQKDAHDAALRQEAEIVAVEMVAKGIAERWITTEAGKKFLKEHAEKAAEALVLTRRREASAKAMGEAAKKKLEALTHKFLDQKKRLEAQLAKKDGALRAKRSKLEAEAEASSGLKRDLKEKEIDAVNEELAALPEALALEELKEHHQDMVDAITEEGEGASAASDTRGVSHSSAEYKKVLGELVTDIGNQYVAREMRKARDAKLREINNMAKIRRAWGGVGLRDAFVGWRRYARLNVNTRVREEARVKRAKFAASQVPKAAIKVARYKVLLWGEPSIDVWSDEKFWTHRKTGEIRWTLPTTKEYCPKNFVMPAEYEGMTDEELDAIRVREDVPFEDVEVPYQNEELGSDASSEEESSDDDSDDDSDDEDEESDEDEADVAARKALRSGASGSTGGDMTTTTDDDEEEDDGSGSGGGSDEEEDEMIEGPEGQLVPSGKKVKRKARLEDMELPEPKPPDPLPVYVERTTTEATDALVRMRDRRVAHNAKARAQQAYALGAKERALLAEQERLERIHLGLPELAPEPTGTLNDSGPKGVSTADVGFDPGKVDYTEEQLTTMAMDLYFKNLERGLDEEGKPIPKSIFGKRETSRDS